MTPALTGFLLLPSQSAQRALVDLPPAPAAAPVTEAPVAVALPAPAPPPSPVAAVAELDPVVEAPAPERRRPARKIVRRLQEVLESQTVVVEIHPPVALPDLLPRVRAEVAGLAVDLDL